MTPTHHIRRPRTLGGGRGGVAQDRHERRATEGPPRHVQADAMKNGPRIRMGHSTTPNRRERNFEVGRDQAGQSYQALIARSKWYHSLPARS